MPTYPLTGTDAATVEARLAVMRLAQTRLGYMDPVLRLTIAGTDRATKVLKNSVRITRDAEAPATASFMVNDIEPIEGQEVKIAIGAIGNLLFAGHITKVSLALPTSASFGAIRYAVQCQDYSWLANKRLVMTQFGSDNVESIINSLISTYTTGFTTRHVNGGLGFLTGPTPFTMETIERCVRRLAKEVNAFTYWDERKDLHFFAAGQDRAPQPHDLTTAYIDFENVQYTIDLSQMVTRVYIEGAGSTLSSNFLTLSSSQMDLDSAADFPAAGGNFRLKNYAPIGSTLLRFNITAGGPPAVTLLGVFQGANAVDLTADLMAAYPNYIPIGTEINLWRMVEDTTAQAALALLDGSDGVREYYIQDRRLSYDAMSERALAELNRLKNPIETISYRTHDPNSRPGSRVTVNLPINLPTPQTLTGTFTLQSVVIADIETADLRQPWYTVTATSNRRTLWDLLNAGRLTAA